MIWCPNREVYIGVYLGTEEEDICCGGIWIHVMM